MDYKPHIKALRDLIIADETLSSPFYNCGSLITSLRNSSRKAGLTEYETKQLELIYELYAYVNDDFNERYIKNPVALLKLIVEHFELLDKMTIKLRKGVRDTWYVSTWSIGLNYIIVTIPKDQPYESRTRIIISVVGFNLLKLEVVNYERIHGESLATTVNFIKSLSYGAVTNILRKCRVKQLDNVDDLEISVAAKPN